VYRGWGINVIVMRRGRDTDEMASSCGAVPDAVLLAFRKDMDWEGPCYDDVGSG
jgi:hypothetical protein